MNEAMDQILTGYADADLDLLAGFLLRTAAASAAAATQLATGSGPESRAEGKG